MNDPCDVLKGTKKGKTVMFFVKINQFKSREETEEVSSLWQTGLYNAHIQGERFLLEDTRVMFSFKDGAVACEARDFLLEQERVEDVQLEGQTYKGKYAEDSESDADRYKKKKAEEKAKEEKKKKKKAEKEKKKAEKAKEKAEKEKKGTPSVEKVEL